MVHSSRMWSAVCSGVPHRQAAEELRPQRYILALKGDPFFTREISSWWDGYARGMVNCVGFVVSLPVMLPFLH